MEVHGASRTAGVGSPDFDTAQGNQYDGEVAVSQLCVGGVTSEDAGLQVLAMIW